MAAGKMMPRAIFLLIASALLSLPVHAQSDGEQSFRKWVDQKLVILKHNRNAGEREKAAEYLGGFECPV